MLLGTPRAIRSDEYMRSTPWRLGTLRRSAEDYRSPLTLDPFYAIAAAPNDGIVEYIVFLDAAAVEFLGPILPDTLVFSLYWWLPTIIVLLAMPLWLQRLGVRRGISWLSAALVVFSPAVAWWSLWSLNSLAWILIAGLLLMWAIDRACSQQSVGLWPILAAATSGIFLARTAFSYFPWAFPLAVAILIPTLSFAIVRDQLRRRILLVGIAAGVGLLVVGLVVMENWDSFEALANTVYPGSRLASGSALNPGFVFGAQHLGVLRQNPTTTSLNQSELSTAYTIMIVPTLVLLVALPRDAWRHMRTQMTAGSLIAVLALFSIWIMTDVPDFIGEAIPFMNRIPPTRLAQIIGMPVIILFAIVLDRYDRFRDSEIPRAVTILTAGILTFLISAWSGALLKSSQIPDLRLRYIWLVSILVAALVVLVIARPRRLISLLGLALGAVTVVILTNPIMMGFGELREGRAAELITSESRDADYPVRWASDNLSSDAVLMANAIPSLSGQQWAGPSREAWMVLDPDGNYVEAWNRGTATVVISPTVGLAAPEIEAPHPDLIVVRLDPCDPALDVFQVTHMIASTPTESPCLSRIGEVNLGGATRFMYRRSTPED